MAEGAVLDYINVGLTDFIHGYCFNVFDFLCYFILASFYLILFVS